MKQVLAFLSTFIIIMMVGIIFLLGSGKNSVKEKVAGAVESFVSEKGGSDSSGSVFDSKLSSDSGKGTDSSDAKTSDSSSEGTSTKRKSKANPITKAVVEKAVDAYVDSADKETKELFNSMSEDDKDIVTDIIAENVSLDSISEMQSYVANGDKDAIEKYAEENLSEEDQEVLKEIMSKYVSD